MKNYLKKLLVGLLVAAMTVTNINYVPVSAEESNEDCYISCGFMGLFADYVVENDNFVKADKEEDGTYSFTLGYVSEGASGWFNTYSGPAWGSDEQKNNITVDQGYTKIFISADRSTVTVKYYTDNTYTVEEEHEVPETEYYIAGGEFSPTTAVKMTKGEEGIWTYDLGLKVASSSEWVSIYTSAGWANEQKMGAYEYGPGYVRFIYNENDKTLVVKTYKDADYTEEGTIEETVLNDTCYISCGFMNLFADYVVENENFVKADNEEDGTFSFTLGQVLTGTSGWFNTYSGPSWSSDEQKNNITVDAGYVKIFITNDRSTVTVKYYTDDTYTVEEEHEVPETEYYIAGGEFSPEKPLKMTKGEDGIWTYDLGKKIASSSSWVSVYTSEGWANEQRMGAYEYGPGYVRFIYNENDKTLVVKTYKDANYTEEGTIEVEEDYSILHIYYPGKDTLTVAFDPNKISASEKKNELGEAYVNTYWGKSCYIPTKESDNWYTIKVYESYGKFQIVANPQNESSENGDVSDKEGTVWIINFGGSENEGDQERYDDLFATGEKYCMYNTLFDSLKEAKDYDDAFAWDYYIAGSTAAFEPDCDKGIFTNYWAQDDYKWNEAEQRYKGKANWVDKMSKDGTKLTWVSSEEAKMFETYALNIYADKSWFGKVGANNFQFLAVANSFVKITYDLVEKKYTVEYFEDKDCTEPTEFEEIAIYYYYGVDGAKDLYLAFNTEIPGLKSTVKYWGRNCYSMTEVGNGWYVFKGYKATYGGYQVVVNPQNEDFSKGDKEDKEGTIWLTDIGDYGDIATSDSDLSRFISFLGVGRNAFIKYNKIFGSQLEADKFTDWTYYVAGSTNAYTNTNAGKGIFSNYWAGDFVKGVDDEGKEYEKKEDTWPDVLTKEKDNVYSVKLGKAVKGTTYAFNVYTEKDWNATNLTGSMGAANPSFKATSNNYVKLYFNRDLKTGKNTWSIEYYTDKECKTKAKMSAPKKLKLKKLKATKGGKIKLSWKAVDGATSYGIYADGKKIGFSKKNSKVIEYKKAGKAVKYTVVARSPQYGNSEQSKALKVTTPGKVKKFKAKGQKKGIKLSWKKAKKAKGYVVYRSTKKKKGFKKVATVKKNKFLDKKAKKGKKYYYKVYAFKKNGKIKVYSNATKAKSAKKK